MRSSVSEYNWQRVRDAAALFAIVGMLLGWYKTGIKLDYRVETLEAFAHEAQAATRDVRDVRKDYDALKERFTGFELRFNDFEQKYDKDTREQRAVNNEILRRLPR